VAEEVNKIQLFKEHVQLEYFVCHDDNKSKKLESVCVFVC